MRIRISQLEFEYPKKTFRLQIPNLEIASGSAAAFVGPSGSGKTTLLRLLAGIHLPKAGQIRHNATELARQNDAARRRFRITQIGFIFQDFQLIEYLNVEENIRLPFRIHTALQWNKQAQEHLASLARATGIADKQERSVGDLSHGERQRVALCRALVTRPPLVLADEPTGNLDPANKRRILDILFAETKKRGATLIMVTHDQDLLGNFDQVTDFQKFQTTISK